jgi:rhamnogalacturonan endolyase
MRTNRMLKAAGLAIFAAAAVSFGAAVTLNDDGEHYILVNGVVSATIEKRSGDLTSLTYKNVDVLANSGGGKAGAYWSLPGTTLVFGAPTAPEIRNDPKTNGGERGTIALHFPYDGKSNTAPADVEILYSLAQNDSALYAMANWDHKPEYPLLTFGPGRFAAKLNTQVFDFLSIDDKRQRLMPTGEDWGAGQVLNMKEAKRLTTGIHKGEVEHKYDYAAVQFETPAYGWSSTQKKLGVWLVTASNEYMSGGPTKMELNAHLDGNQQGYPTLLNVWKGPHYGGTVTAIPKGTEWKKAIGPFALYLNSTDADGAPAALYADALARAASDAAAWPFAWAAKADFYPAKAERATVSGKIVLKDPLTKQADISGLLVGLTHANYVAGRGSTVDWQHDGTYYQFWARANADGTFAIPNVRAGTYTLRAFATGVLGELAKADVTVETGKPLSLGDIVWTPVRDGEQLWDIGTPDRSAAEFANGERAHSWGLYVEYPKDFPNDVRFVIGKSDIHKDWNIMQVPRVHDLTGRGRGDATTWTVVFTLPKDVKGRATLRLALAGTEARSLSIGINGKPAGDVVGLPNTMVIHRDSDRSAWAEFAVPFDAALLYAGENSLTLTVPAGSVTAGVEYDYLRLELNENAAAPTGVARVSGSGAPVGPEGPVRAMATDKPENPCHRPQQYPVDPVRLK